MNADDLTHPKSRWDRLHWAMDLMSFVHVTKRKFLTYFIKESVLLIQMFYKVVLNKINLLLSKKNPTAVVSMHFCCCDNLASTWRKLLLLNLLSSDKISDDVQADE